LALLLLNAVIGIVNEFRAAQALKKLKTQLVINSRVRRDQRWKIVAASDLVPGDVLRIRVGDIVPAVSVFSELSCFDETHV
jgi:H+-transporting ATPase